MPELPEVETVRRGLDQHTPGLEILGGEVLLCRTIAAPIAVADFLAGLQGTVIVRWHRRGKYLLAELKAAAPELVGEETAGWLGVHLRMTGQLLWLEPDAPLHKHTRVRLFFAGDRELRFVDQRTFGQMWWVPPTQSPAAVISGLEHLGPEPFSPEFSLEYLVEQLRHRRRPIKNALLDQSLVAGVGNIYADEALFRSGIRPTRLCTDLQPNQIERLRIAIVEVLKTSLEEGGTTFSSFKDLQGINGNYGGVAWVYNRGGEPCRNCQTLIQRLRLAGRSSHFCPQCQQ